jgi:hypothetical protein
MVNPTQVLIDQFMHRTPQTVFLVSTFLSSLDFIALFYAASENGVLTIPGGIGLWQDHGLLSMILGNCFIPYLARRYHDTVRSIRTSKSVQIASTVEPPLRVLASVMRLNGKRAWLLYAMIFIGLLFWLANTGVHLFGNPQARWAHKVFDSTDRSWSFYASRLHNLYTWLVVLPFCGYVIISSSIQLRRVVLRAFKKNALRYDLLNPDRYGGFRFVEKAQVLFNVLVAIAYVQITLHIQTFERMNAEHIIAYLTMTLLLITGNQIFLFDIRTIIETLKERVLNETKEKVYKDDMLSFDILKYIYDQRLNEFSFVNAATKLSAILIPIGTKFAPEIAKFFI